MPDSCEAPVLVHHPLLYVACRWMRLNKSGRSLSTSWLWRTQCSPARRQLAHLHAGCIVCAKKRRGGNKNKDANPYQDTLRLPQTSFGLRAFAKDREPLFRLATTTNLYRWQREHLRPQADERDFVLHDGPPYANGHLHMGMSCGTSMQLTQQDTHSTKSSKI